MLSYPKFDQAFLYAVVKGNEDIVRMLLESKYAPRANCQNGRALVIAAARGHEAIVRLLLEWSQHAPRADCQNGEALLQAIVNDHKAIVCLLLKWSKHAPRIDCIIVRLFMEWTQDVPRIEYSDELLHERGAEYIDTLIHDWDNREKNITLLLECSKYAPRKYFQVGKAFVQASRKGYIQFVRLLLESKYAPRADYKDGEALVQAALNGHKHIVRLLLEWPKHAPRADCHKAIMGLLTDKPKRKVKT